MLDRCVRRWHGSPPGQGCFRTPVGGTRWAGWRRLSPGKLPFQAHQSAKTTSSPAGRAHFDKHKMLCHDLPLIEAWRDEVVLRPVARVPEKATSKGYSVLFHEATMPNAQHAGTVPEPRARV